MILECCSVAVRWLFGACVVAVWWVFGGCVATSENCWDNVQTRLVAHAVAVRRLLDGCQSAD
eukprot:1913780-Lingulodinium_polyedra.AAC.1